jgi:hypothetical protein
MTPALQRLTASGPDEHSDGAAAAGTQTTGTGTSLSTPRSFISFPVGKLSRRCGMPRNETYQHDRHFLTRDHMLSDPALPQSEATELSSFFVLKCQYLAFFQSTDVRPGTGLVTPTVAASVRPPFGREQAAEAIHEKPMTLGDYIMGSRRFSASSTSTISPTPSPAPGAVRKASDWKCASPAPVGSPGAPSSQLCITFKLFKDGAFSDVGQVDAGNPPAVAAAAQSLMDDKKLPFSLTLNPLRPDECFAEALASGLRTIIVLPQNEVEVSPKLKTAIKQLHDEALHRTR